MSSQPSKKIVALGIMCVAVLAVVGIYKWLPRYNPETPLPTTESPEINLEIQTSQTDRDSDKDGLADWQEGLWGSDPQNPDSDGDKTNDGEEVNKGRNPTLRGPDDLQATTSASAGFFAKSDAKGFDSSLSGNISKEMFYSFVNAKKSRGVAFSNEDIAEITAQLSSSAEQSKIVFEKYQIDSIGTFSDSDLIRAQEYGEKFGKLYITSLTKLANIPDTNPEAMINEFGSISRDLAALYVPSSLQKTHSEIVNDLYNTGIILQIINQYETDPIKAIVALKSLRQIEDRKIGLFTTIANYFRRNDIIFKNPATKELWENI